MYIYIGLTIVYMRLRQCLQQSQTDPLAPPYIYTYTYTYTYIYICIYMYISIYIYIYLYISLYIYRCRSIHIYISTYLSIYPYMSLWVNSNPIYPTLSIHLCILHIAYLRICQCLKQPQADPLAPLYIYTYTYTYICLSTHPSIYVFVEHTCLYICTYVYNYLYISTYPSI